MEKEVKDFIEFSEQYDFEIAPYIVINSYRDHYSSIECTKKGAITFASELLKGVYSENKDDKSFYSFQYGVEDISSGGVVAGLKVVEEQKLPEFNVPKTVSKFNKLINGMAELFGLAIALILTTFFGISMLVGIFTVIDFLLG